MSAANTLRNLYNGGAPRTSDNAETVHNTLIRNWGVPLRETRIGTLGDLSKAREEARSLARGEEISGAEHFRGILAASLAGQDYEEGTDAAVDAVLETARDLSAPETRSAAPDETRAAIDASVVQEATPIEVDPQIVSIIDDQAPLLDLVQTEAQAGFTAQYSVISDQSAPVGAVSEAEAIDLTDKAYGDFSLQTESEDMGIWVDVVSMSDFTQRSQDSLGHIDVEQTTLGERVKVYSKYTAGELLYGDPKATVGPQGSIQSKRASRGLARMAQDAADNDVGAATNVVDKSTVSGGYLEDIKKEVTRLATRTGATYSDLVAVTSPDFYDAVENEANTVVRLSGYDEDIEIGGRQITIKQDVPLEEVRAVGRQQHGQMDYVDASNGGNFTPDDGDVFIFDQSTFRRRQLAPLSSVPLARTGLADTAALFCYRAHIDKSLGAHIKYLQGYDF